jgi:hypothetical protein
VVGFYIYETHKLRREAQTQTELQLRPFVIFAPTEGKEFCVRNIGNNTALNVKVGTFSLSSPPLVMAAFPRPVAFLHTGESQFLQARTTTVGGETVNNDVQFDILRPRGEFLAEPEATPFRPTITIEFENVNGRRYFVQESLLYGDIEIMNSGPVVLSSSSKLLSAPQMLQSVKQKLWTTWQQLKLHKRKKATAPPDVIEQDWVDKQ